MNEQLTDGDREVLAELQADAWALEPTADDDFCDFCGAPLCPTCWGCPNSRRDAGGCTCPTEAEVQAELDRERDAILQMEREQAADDAAAFAQQEAQLGAWLEANQS